jgi:hypothetical protein
MHLIVTGNSEKEFLLMQAKDLSHELRHTRTVCDSLKDEVHFPTTTHDRTKNVDVEIRSKYANI